MTTSTILSDNGATSGTSGLKTSGGNDGTLILQTTTAGGTATTALTIDTSQNTTLAGSATAKSFIPNNSTVPTDGLYLPAASTVALSTGTTERMRIDSSGNVGIGTTPAASQKVIVSLATQSPTTGSPANGSLFTLSGGTTTAGNGPSLQIQNFSGAKETAWRISAVTTSGNNGDLVFNGYAGGADYPERARITSGGEFLVGKTASGTSNLGAEVRGTGFIGSTLSGSTNATDSYNLYSTGAGAYRFYVSMDGKINATNTTIAAISDIRLKENIRDLDVGLAEILSLKPRKFDWKEGKGKNIKDDRGWIAQEFEQTFPDMIGTWKDEPPEGEEPYKSVSADLIPVLVKAIQELKAINDAQATRIETLEAQNAAFEARLAALESK